MSIEKQSSIITTERESDTQTAPSQGDLLVFEGDYEFQLSELSIEAEESNTFSVVVRDSGGGNATTTSTFVTDSIDKGTFDDPVAEVGAQREIAITIGTEGSVDTDYVTNYVIDRRRA